MNIQANVHSHFVTVSFVVYIIYERKIDVLTQRGNRVDLLETKVFVRLCFAHRGAEEIRRMFSHDYDYLALSKVSAPPAARF